MERESQRSTAQAAIEPPRKLVTHSSYMWCQGMRDWAI